MKKLYIVFILIFVLFGCSNEAKDPTAEASMEQTVTEESLSLEEQISKVMSENKLRDKEIIDYDLKDDFIYVIFKNKHGSNSHNPDLVILKNNNGKLEWIAGPKDRTTSMSLEHIEALVFGRDDGPSVTIIMPEEDASDTKIKEVKVLGESTKAVTYVKHIMEGFSKQYMYWIAYTEEAPTHEDFEVIMQ
ncbi:hypothetical protein [Virgibacillus necropolis]|uniref:Lipoprotein n=1 Tax=Virgibacillus necropolis TaxID=163877 RepID=A0A221MID0_9BACI|nr:hypothetical protein [Virgibacillus necropolis]ASN07423.1 hypothetical protein CFK40_15900 [Virgibacillus necropolis]